MRNIWQIVVGVVLVIGIGIAIYNALEDDAPNATGLVSATPIAAGAGSAGETGAADSDVAQSRPPRPDGEFGEIQIAADEFVLGKADAPVTIVEYASLTCPHCADFHNNVVPVLKKDYIDAGKVRLVYRDFPLDGIAVAASMLARCSGRERFFGFLDVLYRSQANWSRAQNPLDALGKIALLGGLSKEAFDACLKDEKLQTAILQQRMDGATKFKVSGTPTLFINGTKYSGMSAGQMRALVDSMLPRS